MIPLWTALVIGFAGNLHCLGMCGPIAVSLPGHGGAMSRRILGRLAYNVGRMVTYATLGLVAGAVGHAVSLAGWQQWLSIAAGVSILLMILLPSRWLQRATGGWTAMLVARLKQRWQALFAQPSVPALFGIGLLNGLLPCGLVYVALAGAVATGTMWQGALYMAAFGAGTFPGMLLVSLFGSTVIARLRGGYRRLLPIGGALLAVLFILRGLSLGIPYISPRMNHAHGAAAVESHPHPAPTEAR
ncbi:MAG: sulfite exporter TauE/SafE family protein [Candidatus Zixiibacteriota bacterium]|nr:MAG: sulfite exporter TauE/SafE family protein [candidate division Zixibacteria bacterium]